MERRSPLQRRTPLQGGGRLPQMSARRRAEQAERGNTDPFTTLTNSSVSGGGVPRMAAPAPKRRPKPADTGPDATTVAAVWARDHGRCVRCGRGLGPARGWDWSMQHRRARQGTDSRPDTNQPTNLILLCGSATTGCHGHVESYRAEARAGGWAVRQSDVPAAMPVRHAVHGWVLLSADGSHTTATPNQEQHQTEGAAA